MAADPRPPRTSQIVRAAARGPRGLVQPDFVHPDDVRIARVARELRRRSGMTQREAAQAGTVSLEMLRRIENEQAAVVPLGVIRAALALYEARVRASIWRNGADLDRTLDQEHAAIVELVISILRARGWLALPEVSYSEWGERGSIDILGAHSRGVGVVVEVKSDVGSTEETNRLLDVKTRLAPKLIRDRFGLDVSDVGRLLVLPDQMRLRRIALRYAATLDVLYPARGREVRRWLRTPTGPLSGLWFLSFGGDSRPRNAI